MGRASSKIGVSRYFSRSSRRNRPARGRGLGLYISRDMAEYHGWKLYMDDAVGRVREGRLNTFVLDMGSR